MSLKASDGSLKVWQQSLIAAALGFLVSALLIVSVGENPLAVLRILVQAAFASSYDLGYSIFYAVPLVCAALAVSIGLRAKLFNIGVEGQLTIAALAAALMGLYGPQDPLLNRFLGLISAVLAGFLWGSLLGYLRAWRQAHEVVVGIMLNFVAYGLTSWLTLNFFKNPANPNPETAALADSIRIGAWSVFTQTPLGWHALLAPLAAWLTWSLYRWTRFGFAMEACGENPTAASHAGISIKSMQFWALSLGGGLAGLVGFIEVYGNSGRFIVGFSPGYGFIGIAVALVGRLQPLGIICAALFFGVLHKGSMDLDFETEWITRDFAVILQAVLILSMSCTVLVPPGIYRLWYKWKRKSHGNSH